MSTPFCQIYALVRAAVQDYDSNAYIYSDAALMGQVNLVSMELGFDPNNPPVPQVTYTQTVPGVFDNTLTVQQQLQLALTVAIALLSGKATKFSYRSPAMAVSREGGVLELLSRLEGVLDALNGGRFSIATDTDFDAIIQAFDRYINDFNRATAAWPGQPPL